MDVAKENNQTAFIEYMKTLPLKGKPAPPPHKDTMVAINADVLIHGCKHGKIDDVRVCLEEGVAVNGADDDWNPLMWAAYYGHIEVGKLLVAFGANVQHVAKFSGKNALDCAKENNQQALVNYLLHAESP
ncbi:hypothetical protein H310_12519 [Aphanomyces invadans]|uniref:Uncharacterized protein n=1 Tax=Aphanomyces invadans TaxID=157072 RepID=A0A024THE2_9STRA|nr:hypothetical protein H310_12519 [Aphanomyces invadans]ETV93468.1 hypothetical protein H310_12519 [Aphanomyces invadans]|eukprot:XP_008877810.1 hypothetical protein H310_12519 [Aphanomyces invadans]